MDAEHEFTAGYRSVDGEAAAVANRTWWSEGARSYLTEHGDFLDDVQFSWGPEGLLEADARLLGPLPALRGKRILEIGAGAAQCARWLVGHGLEVVACDVAEGMVAQSATLDDRTGISVPAVVADARELPFADGSFDVVFTAFGAIPFLSDAGRVHTEAFRVIRPGGRWVFSVTHPFKWALPDDPGEAGLRIVRSYFDRTPYVETDEAGEVGYAEFHRTMGDHIRDIVGAGFHLTDLVEPQWPDGVSRTWGAWGPVRGAYLPGTAIFRCRRPTIADRAG